MAGKIKAPYGTWKSPITAELIANGAVRFGKVCLDQDDVYWLETRPQDNGREVIVRSASDGRLHDVTPTGFDARTRVHEFGGGAFTVFQGRLFFSNLHDQRIYMQVLQPDGSFSKPEAQTPPSTSPEKQLRYADVAVDPKRNRLICVLEDHRHEGKPVASIISIWLDGSRRVETLVLGADFYSSPRVSSDGTKLAWLSWSHPNMPWDTTELWVGEFNPEGSLSGKSLVQGGGTDAICQPEWSPSGQLYFVSDRTGWWNIYRQSDEGKAEPLLDMAAEFGMTHIYFGHSTYAFADAETVYCACAENGMWRLGQLNTRSLEYTAIETPFQEFTYLRANKRRLVFRGGGPGAPVSIMEWDPQSKATKTLRSSLSVPLSQLRSYFSQPECIEFPTGTGQRSRGFLYRPRNREWEGPLDEVPPLIVKVHGGPNNQTFNSLDLSIQYWTSRGFSVVDVNYRGSSGFGRTYRDSLKGGWGILEVEDCANAARHLVERGLADTAKTIIQGMSAGGYATICAVTFQYVFRAGTAYFGISDMEAMAGSFHKFQSSFLHSMIGPYPERSDLYQNVSAINFVDSIDCPLLLLHGALDTIVPIEQSLRLAQALTEQRKPVAFIAFADEPHVFRKAANIKKALEAELNFYGQVFGFSPADELEELPIEHLNENLVAASKRR